MTRRPLLRMDSRIFLLAGGLAIAGCSSPPSTHCTPVPAFHLTVGTADELPLPGTTTVQIRYGGQSEETFRLDAPASSPQALFCHGMGGAGAAGAGGSGGGASGQGADRIECELWTDGAAQVIVEAPGYERYDQELAATKDDQCGAKTTEAQVTLATGASGAGGATGSSGSGGSS